MMKHVNLALAAAFASFVAAPVSAATYAYTYVSDTLASDNFSFTLDTEQAVLTPPPGDYFLNQARDQTGAAIGSNLVAFSRAPNNGGVSTDNGIGLRGATLYTGPESSPTYVTGVFRLFIYTAAPNRFGTLTVVNASVPEPATWAFMLTGFGLVGAGLRARRSSATFSKA